eukprot:TRINITY_DN11859_c0_g1_i1.p1 TRINITY_DN11859_c0_g1~~TRINITY_DN11859_c0_g1_i1.p1  ORF type:complete len:108 (+),score=2.74 TRINITY_DN11859_c0_g1_i1:229-552(+)
MSPRRRPYLRQNKNADRVHANSTAGTMLSLNRDPDQGQESKACGHLQSHELFLDLVGIPLGPPAKPGKLDTLSKNTSTLSSCICFHAWRICRIFYTQPRRRWRMKPL